MLRTRFLSIFSTICFALIIQTSMADENSDWSPQVDKFDWVQLTSGEWLKGEIKAFYNRSLEFDSDKLDLLIIDWEDVHFLESHINSIVHLEGHNQKTGRIRISGDSINIINDDSSQQFNREDLISFITGEVTESNYWSGKISLGLNFKRGNTDTTDYNASATIKRRTSKTRLNLDYVGNLSLNDTEKTINNHRLNFKFDYFKTRYFFYQPVFGEVYHDPFQNIEYRLIIGAGLGYTVIDTQSTEWNISGGPSLLKTEFITVESGEDRTEKTPSLVLSTNYENEVSRSIDIIAKYDITLANDKSGGYTHHAVLTLENEITGSFDLDISIFWDHISSPTANDLGELPEADDYKLFLGVGYDF